MAKDCAALMEALGHTRFAAVGHDRGCYVAHRLALDYRERVTHLAALDAVPIGEALARCNSSFATKWWHWFFYGQASKPAERYISFDPDAWYGGDPDTMGQEAYDDYREAIHDPETVHAMMEDYRAGLTVDRALDDADKAAGAQVECPILVLWATRDDMAELYGDPLAVWHEWGTQVHGGEIDSGHHIAEEAPVELVRELLSFLRQ
jgi:haloacetate dehalogenase